VLDSGLPQLKKHNLPSSNVHYYKSNKFRKQFLVQVGGKSHSGTGEILY
jgi:hypothetical protein